MSESRLAHGTDQGKWLIQEVRQEGARESQRPDSRLHFQMVSYDLEEGKEEVQEDAGRKGILASLLAHFFNS